MTRVSVVLVTVAVNCCVRDENTLGFAGEIETCTAVPACANETAREKNARNAKMKRGDVILGWQLGLSTLQTKPVHLPDGGLPDIWVPLRISFLR